MSSDNEEQKILEKHRAEKQAELAAKRKLERRQLHIEMREQEERDRNAVLNTPTPKPQVGSYYYRPNGEFVRSADGGLVPWHSTAYEQKLLQKMLQEYVDAIGGADVVKQILKIK